jgi:hypothetical protein
MTKRVRYYPGMLLSESDFTAEQEYFIDRMKRHNRLFHGSGIISGLEVSLHKERVHICAGVAVDCEGNEIILEVPEHYTLPADTTTAPQYLSLHYAEREVDPVPVVDPASAGRDREPSRIEEGFKLEYESRDALVEHPLKGSLRAACNGRHGITLAKFESVGGRWLVEQRPHVLREASS